MRRLLGPLACAALICFLALALAACGDPEADDAGAQDGSPTAEASGTPRPSPTPSPEPPTAAPTAPAPVRPVSPTVVAPAPQPTSALPSRVTLDFSTLPDWNHHYDSGTATVADGILTLDVPAGFNEFQIEEPGSQFVTDEPWLEDVSNERGWWVETRLRVDPLTEDQCASDNLRGPALTMWLTDDTAELVQIGFSPGGVCLILSHDQAIKVPMNTTADFHVYRVSRQLRRIRLWVDGALVIDHQAGALGGTIPGIIFGDGVSGGGPTRSYWDYLTYDVSGAPP